MRAYISASVGFSDGKYDDHMVNTSQAREFIGVEAPKVGATAAQIRAAREEFDRLWADTKREIDDQFDRRLSLVKKGGRQ